MIRIKIKDGISRQLKQYQAEFRGVLIDSALVVRDLIAERAILFYMRVERRGAGGVFPPRSPQDMGPLRILSGRLSRGLLGDRLSRQFYGRSFRGGSSETEIRTINEGPLVGVSQRVFVPYAAIHEYGGIAGRGAVIPARPYLEPATQNVSPEIPGIFENGLDALARQLGLD